MYMFWYAIIMSSAFLVSVVLPFGLFYAETDEEKEFKWRICSAFKNEVILLVLIAIVIFPLYASINYSYFPITVFTCNADDDSTFIGANID